MSSLATPSVWPVAGITVPSTGSTFVSYTYQLFEVPQGIPSRIEAVSIIATYPNPPAITDVYEICLVSQAGYILDRQPTPTIGVNMALDTAYLNWVRRGNDTAQNLAFEFSTSDDSYATAWFRGSLPDFVLESQGTVVLNIYRASDGDFVEIDLSGINVTYTPAGTGTAQSTTDILPLLVPTTTG